MRRPQDRSSWEGSAPTRRQGWRAAKGLREVTLGGAGATNIGLGVPGKVAGEWIESQVK